MDGSRLDAHHPLGDGRDGVVGGHRQHQVGLFDVVGGKPARSGAPRCRPGGRRPRAGLALALDLVEQAGELGEIAPHAGQRHCESGNLCG